MLIGGLLGLFLLLRWLNNRADEKALEELRKR